MLLCCTHHVVCVAEPSSSPSPGDDTDEPHARLMTIRLSFARRQSFELASRHRSMYLYLNCI